MAEQYDDNNRFVLFKQDKGDNANRPDYTGTVKVEGKEWRLAAWISESKNGLKYLGLFIFNVVIVIPSVVLFFILLIYKNL